MIVTFQMLHRYCWKKNQWNEWELSVAVNLLALSTAQLSLLPVVLFTNHMHPVWCFVAKPKSSISQREWSPVLAPVYKLLTLLFLTVLSTISLPSVNLCMYWLTASLSCTFKVWNPFMRSDSIGGTATHFLLVHFTTIVVWNRHFFKSHDTFQKSMQNS